MQKITVKTLKKTTGVPDARIAVSTAEHDGENAVMMHVSAEDSLGFPDVVARIVFAPPEAERVGMALVNAAAETSRMHRAPAATVVATIRDANNTILRSALVTPETRDAIREHYGAPYLTTQLGGGLHVVFLEPGTSDFAAFQKVVAILRNERGVAIPLGEQDVPALDGAPDMHSPNSKRGV